MNWLSLDILRVKIDFYQFGFLQFLHATRIIWGKTVYDFLFFRQEIFPPSINVRCTVLCLNNFLKMPEANKQNFTSWQIAQPSLLFFTNLFLIVLGKIDSKKERMLFQLVKNLDNHQLFSAIDIHQGQTSMGLHAKD